MVSESAILSLLTLEYGKSIHQVYNQLNIILINKLINFNYRVEEWSDGEQQQGHQHLHIQPVHPRDDDQERGEHRDQLRCGVQL